MIAPNNPTLLSDDVPFVDYDEYDAQIFKPAAHKTFSRYANSIVS